MIQIYTLRISLEWEQWLLPLHHKGFLRCQYIHNLANLGYKTGIYMSILHSYGEIFRAQEPKAPVTYCDHALSGVRRPSVVRCPSSVRLFTFLTSSPEPLDRFWWLGMDEVLKVPYKCCCFSARSAKGRIQGGAKIGHGGSPSSTNFFRPESYSNKPNA